MNLLQRALSAVSSIFKKPAVQQIERWVLSTAQNETEPLFVLSDTLTPIIVKTKNQELANRLFIVLNGGAADRIAIDWCLKSINGNNYFTLQSNGEPEKLFRVNLDLNLGGVNHHRTCLGFMDIGSGIVSADSRLFCATQWGVA
jgi:hypothetical protein